MPSFAALGDENLTKIATFLEASKGAAEVDPAAGGCRA